MIPPKQTLAALGIAAAAQAAAAQTAYQWAAPFDGLWSLSSNWDPAGVPGSGSSGDTVDLGLAGAYTVTADTSRTIAGLSINNPDAVLAVRSGFTLTVNGPVTGAGTLVVHDQFSTSLATVDLGEGAVVTSPVRLNAQSGASTRARIAGQGAGATLDTEVSGNGRLLGVLHNDGLIATELPGDEIFVATTGPLTSTGIVRAVNAGTLNLASGLDGGTLHADADSRVLGGSAGVANATLTGDLVIASADSLTLGPGNTHNGSITVHDQSSGSITDLNLAEGAILGGSVLLNAPIGADTRARITGLGAGATIDADITGTGRLLGVLHNAGTVSADQPGGQIFVTTTGPLTSTGIVRAVNAGTLNLASGLDGGTLHADADSRVLGGSAGIANATLTGTAVVAAGNTLYLQPGNTYNGSLVINDQSSTSITTVFLSDASTLGGEVVLNTTPDNTTRARIQGPGLAGQSAGIAPDAVIRGQGRLLGLIDPFLGTLSPGFDDRRGEINLLTGEPLVLDPGSQSVFTLGDADSDSYDRVTVSGGLELGGTLVVSIEDGVTPQFGDRWDIVQGALGITGFYDAYDLPDAPPGLAYRVVIQPNGVFVRLTCAADFDGDLTLNFFDLSSFLTAYNTQDPRADFAAPFGAFNFFDVSAYLSSFNAGCP